MYPQATAPTYLTSDKPTYCTDCGRSSDRCAIHTGLTGQACCPACTHAGNNAHRGVGGDVFSGDRPPRVA